MRRNFTFAGVCVLSCCCCCCAVAVLAVTHLPQLARFRFDRAQAATSLSQRGPSLSVCRGRRGEPGDARSTVLRQPNLRNESLLLLILVLKSSRFACVECRTPRTNAAASPSPTIAGQAFAPHLQRLLYVLARASGERRSASCSLLLLWPVLCACCISYTMVYGTCTYIRLAALVVQKKKASRCASRWYILLIPHRLAHTQPECRSPRRL